MSQCKEFKLGSKLYHFIITGSRRFISFRRGDEDATKCGIAQKCKMNTREEVTEDEEAILVNKLCINLQDSSLLKLSILIRGVRDLYKNESY